MCSHKVKVMTFVKTVGQNRKSKLGIKQQQNKTNKEDMCVNRLSE